MTNADLTRYFATMRSLHLHSTPYGYEGHGDLLEGGCVERNCLAALDAIIQQKHGVTEPQIVEARSHRRARRAAGSRLRGLDFEHRPLVAIDPREKVEDHLQEILSIEQSVHGEPLIAFDQRRRRVEPRALDAAANVADRHPHPRVVPNALDLPRIGFRIHVERVVVQHKPDWRLHALAVLLERF